MTNAAAPIGLTANSTDVQDADLGIFLEIVRGLNESPSVRGTDTIVPGLAGRVARNRVADVLTIELRGIVTGAGADEAAQRSDYRTNVNTVRALFDPTSLVTLVAALEDGTSATITARPLNLVWDQLLPTLANVSIEMESIDPDWVIGS